VIRNYCLLQKPFKNLFIPHEVIRNLEQPYSIDQWYNNHNFLVFWFFWNF